MWHSHSTNRAGRTLFEHAHLNDYSIVARDTQTHFPSNTRYRPDVLDIAIVRTPLQIRITDLDELSSDHNPIIMELSSSAITTPPPNSGRYINRRKFTKDLSQDLSDTFQNLNTTTEIEEAISKLTNTINSTMKKCEFKPPRHKSPNQLPEEILKEIRVKNQIRRLWQQTRNHKHRTKNRRNN